MKGKFIRKLLALTASAVLAFSAVPVQAEEGTFTTHGAAGAVAPSGAYSAYLENVQYHQDKARDMLAFVNDFRTSGTAWYWNEGNTAKVENVEMSSLTYDYGLEEIAMQRAAEIAASFSHTRPNGTPCFTCLSSNGSMSYAENIAVGTTSVSATFDMWKEESANYEGQGHRRNMLGDYQAVGIGCAEVNGVYFWVQEFGASTGTAAVPACLDTKSVSMEVAESRIASGYFNTAQEMDVTVGDTVDIPQAYCTAVLDDAMISVNVMIDGGINYTTDDESIAAVSDGKITGVTEGTCRLQAHLGNQTFESVLNVVTDGSHSMYRLYNPNSGEHFYTASAAERDHLKAVGWNDEGLGWYAPNASHTPVYRLYNAKGGEHHYTTKIGERNNLIKQGWNYESIGWYSDDNHGTPLYRVYNLNAFANNHHYTTNAAEKTMLVKLGWRDEGIGWYGVKG